MTASRTARAAVALLPALLGLAIYFLPTIRTQGARLPGGQSDSRHIRWILEWQHQCLTGAPVCRDWLSPPIFHPVRGTLPSSELLLGQLPVYSVFRLTGAGPATAHQLSIAAFLLAAYFAGRWLIRRFVDTPLGGAELGAFLFAFGAPRTAQTDHPQLIAFFALPVVLGALGIALGVREGSASSSRRAWFAAAGGMAFQAYASLGLAWLFAWWLSLALLATLVLPSTRATLFATLRRDRWTVLSAAVFALLAVAPLALLHAEARARFGSAASFEDQVRAFLPRLSSWVDLGNGSWESRGLRALGFDPSPPKPWEHELGFGLVTAALCFVGVWICRRRPWAQVLVAASFAAVALPTLWPGGFTAWQLLHPLLPGAEAVRAVGRIVLVLLLPAALALAAAWSRLAARSAWRLVPPALALVVMAEQARIPRSHLGAVPAARVAELTGALPEECDAFYVSRGGPKAFPSVFHVDAMWAALATGVPTSNGWTSYAPAEWEPLFDSVAESAEKVASLRMRLDRWARTGNLRPGGLCWIHLGAAGAADERRVERLPAP